MPPPVRSSNPEDIEAIVDVVNAAFLPAERFFVEGDRTSADEIREMLDRGTFLLAERDGVLAACVYVKIRGEDGYFGMLSVHPRHQREGLGRVLVDAAEEYARQAGCTVMEIHVVDLRTELLPFYLRLGYVETGVEPMPPDPKLTKPCRFLVMRKPLAG
jgi:GNAT superfamily N-acetyltransferase